MCVQYCGGVQNLGGYHEYCGGYLEYRGGVQYHGGYHDKCGVYLEYHGVFSTIRGISWVPWGIISSTVGDVQYHGDIMMHVEGYHEYRGGYLVPWGEIFCYFKYPMALNTPMVLMISPTCIMISPHSTQISKDGIPHSTEHPTVLMISLHMHHDIPHCTHDIPPRASWYPPLYWTPPQYSWYPTVLNIPTVLKIFNMVLNTPWYSRYPPRYSWYPPRYWTPPQYWAPLRYCTHIIQDDNELYTAKEKIQLFDLAMAVKLS